MGGMEWSDETAEWWLRPFVLPSVDGGRDSTNLLTLLRARLASTRVDFYRLPFIDRQAVHRRITLGRALNRTARAGGYILADLSQRHWKLLLGGLPEPPFMLRRQLPEHECAGVLAPANLTSAFERSLKWRMLTLGSTGAGMHAHVDFPPTSSWHLQLAGRKVFQLCPPEGTAASPSCTEVTLSAGESVYYPGGWWHRTSVLEPWTVSISRRLITPSNAADVSAAVATFCDEARSLGSHEHLCDALRPCLARLRNVWV